MTAADAAKILDLPPDATPEQLEKRFNELRAKLEDKIAKAPTPGLKAKYRESLDEITLAFETLTLAADASSLPVARRAEASGGLSSAGGRPSPSPNQEPAQAPAGRVVSRPAESRKPKAKSLEFAIVAVVAIAVLAGGGWWLVKTRAEKAEAARVAAEQKAEDERQAAAAQAEKDRLAAVAREEAEAKQKAAEAEKVRQEKLTAQLRAQLAEYKITWEAFEREERNAERQFSDLKSELRSLRDAPATRMNEMRATLGAHEDYSTWIRETLSRHPARITRSKAEEMLSGKQLDEAQEATAELKKLLAELETEIGEQKRRLLDIDGDLAIDVAPEVEWSVADFFGRKRSGKGPVTLNDVAVGNAEVQLELTGWPARKSSVVISRSKPATVSTEFKGFDVKLVTAPEGASVVAGERTLGVTPFVLRNMPPGSLNIVVRKEGFYDQKAQLAFPPSASEVTMKLRERSENLTLPDKPSFPEKMRYEASSESVHDMTRSTGAYADGAKMTTTQVHAVEDWDFSKPDAEGQWTEMVRRFVSYNVSGVASTLQNGSVIRYKRAANGSWSGTFERGGTTDPAYNDIHLKHFTPQAFIASTNAFWPPPGTPVGGTWKIKPSDLPGFASFPNLSGDATGRILDVARGEDTDIVDIEVRYNIVWFATADYKQPMNGRMRFQIDLRDGYYVRNESESSSSTSLKAALVGTLASDSRTKSSATLRKR